MTLKLSEIKRHKSIGTEISSIIEHHLETGIPWIFGDTDLARIGKNYSAWRQIWTESLKRSH